MGPAAHEETRTRNLSRWSARANRSASCNHAYAIASYLAAGNQSPNSPVVRGCWIQGQTTHSCPNWNSSSGRLAAWPLARVNQARTGDAEAKEQIGRAHV